MLNDIIWCFLRAEPENSSVDLSYSQAVRSQFCQIHKLPVPVAPVPYPEISISRTRAATCEILTVKHQNADGKPLVLIFENKCSIQRTKMEKRSRHSFPALFSTVPELT